MPLLSATGPVQEQNRDVNDPAEGAHGPISPRPRGRSRLGCRCPSWPCCTVLIPRANTPRSSGESWSILPGTPTLRSELFGSDGARQGFPPTRRRCAALTRAMRSRCSGQLSERRQDQRRAVGCHFRRARCLRIAKAASAYSVRSPPQGSGIDQTITSDFGIPSASTTSAALLPIAITMSNPARSTLRTSRG